MLLALFTLLFFILLTVLAITFHTPNDTHINTQVIEARTASLIAIANSDTSQINSIILQWKKITGVAKSDVFLRRWSQQAAQALSNLLSPTQPTFTPESAEFNFMSDTKAHACDMKLSILKLLSITTKYYVDHGRNFSDDIKEISEYLLISDHLYPNKLARNMLIAPILELMCIPGALLVPHMYLINPDTFAEPLRPLNFQHFVLKQSLQTLISSTNGKINLSQLLAITFEYRSLEQVERHKSAYWRHYQQRTQQYLPKPLFHCLNKTVYSLAQLNSGSISLYDVLFFMAYFHYYQSLGQETQHLPEVLIGYSASLDKERKDKIFIPNLLSSQSFYRHLDQTITLFVYQTINSINVSINSYDFLSDDGWLIIPHTTVAKSQAKLMLLKTVLKTQLSVQTRELIHQALTNEQRTVADQESLYLEELGNKCTEFVRGLQEGPPPHPLRRFSESSSCSTDSTAADTADNQSVTSSSRAIIPPVTFVVTSLASRYNTWIQKLFDTTKRKIIPRFITIPPNYEFNSVLLVLKSYFKYQAFFKDIVSKIIFAGQLPGALQTSNIKWMLKLSLLIGPRDAKSIFVAPYVSSTLRTLTGILFFIINADLRNMIDSNTHAIGEHKLCQESYNSCARCQHIDVYLQKMHNYLIDRSEIVFSILQLPQATASTVQNILRGFVTSPAADYQSSTMLSLVRRLTCAACVTSAQLPVEQSKTAIQPQQMMISISESATKLILSLPLSVLSSTADLSTQAQTTYIQRLTYIFLAPSEMSTTLSGLATEHNVTLSASVAHSPHELAVCRTLPIILPSLLDKQCSLTLLYQTILCVYLMHKQFPNALTHINSIMTDCKLQSHFIKYGNYYLRFIDAIIFIKIILIDHLLWLVFLSYGLNHFFDNQHSILSSEDLYAIDFQHTSDNESNYIMFILKLMMFLAFVSVGQYSTTHSAAPITIPTGSSQESAEQTQLLSSSQSFNDFINQHLTHTHK